MQTARKKGAFFAILALAATSALGVSAPAQASTVNSAQTQAGDAVKTQLPDQWKMGPYDNRFTCTAGQAVVMKKGQRIIVRPCYESKGKWYFIYKM